MLEPGVRLLFIRAIGSHSTEYSKFPDTLGDIAVQTLMKELFDGTLQSASIELEKQSTFGQSELDMKGRVIWHLLYEQTLPQ